MSCAPDFFSNNPSNPDFDNAFQSHVFPTIKYVRRGQISDSSVPQQIPREFDHYRIPLEDIIQATNNFAEENIIEKYSCWIVYKGELSGKKLAFILVDAEYRLNFGIAVMLSSMPKKKHQNVVPLICRCDEDDKMILVLEYPTHGSLDKYAKIQLITPSNAFLELTFPRKFDPIESFGVILFELLCGRLAVTEDEDERFLISLASKHYEKGTLTEIIDPLLRVQMSRDSFAVFSEIAYACVDMNKDKRPTISKVVEELQKALRLQQGFEISELEHVKSIQHMKIPLEEIRAETHDFDDDFTIPRGTGKEKAKGRPTMADIVEELEKAYKYHVEKLKHLKIPFKEIYSATHGFDDSRMIGWGGFGGVYQAELFHVDVRKYVGKKESLVELYGYPRRKGKVALKRREIMSDQGRKEFWKEIDVLSGLNHQNIISLVGFCYEYGEMIIIYDYASNGSFEKYIRNVQNLKWEQRLQICIDAAQGLNYLHNHHIIHRDVKSPNILLGDSLEGMIGDVGLSITVKNTDSWLSNITAVGTGGYVDPKYLKRGILSKQSDMYSFGVVLLEVLCGRFATTSGKVKDRASLVDLAGWHLSNNQPSKIIGKYLRKDLEDEKFLDSVKTFAAITHDCLHSTDDDETHRLTMADVLKGLKKALTVHSVGSEPFSLEEINSATNNFSKEHVIGSGASCKIYKRELSFSKKSIPVAVKRLDRARSYEEGRLAIDKVEKYSHPTLRQIIDAGDGVKDKKDAGNGVKDEKKAGDGVKDKKSVFLAWMAARCFEDKKLEALIFDDIKEQTDKKSIDILSKVAYACFQKDIKKRPTMALVIQELEKALNIHVDWEFEQKLPKDNENIMKMIEQRESEEITKKDLYPIFSSGIRLNNGKVLLSLNKDGKAKEMISATTFSYEKCWSSKLKVLENSRSDNQIFDFEVQLESLWGHPCGGGPIFVDGIEFRPIDNGIIPAIAKVFPAAEHRFCVRHIYENMKQKWKGEEYKKLVWKCASATTVQYFDRAMDKLKKLDEEAYDYLRKIPAQNWSRSHFSGHNRRTCKMKVAGSQATSFAGSQSSNVAGTQCSGVGGSQTSARAKKMAKGNV
ncbi:protein kinase-like domain-containing protein [Artemisia annua]|uniref:Protein kinase-like domain-containing protein n=1 Tax=Artemisia annua TaxID=35608 RepID=A0A2U1P706_ARTAN|nr:protein kinase-like domain-containing protein [Artemisia annua]